MQKKNRKGFTLIELLAVIVILAIIALIAVPVIMNVITKARVSAFEDSAYGIVKAGEMYYTNKLLDAEGMTKSVPFTIENGVFTSTEKLDVSGSLPSSGQVIVTSEGKVALAISNGEYCIRKATTESKVKAEKLSDLDEKCELKKETGKPNTVFTAATGETSIPACITNNTECGAGTPVAVKVNNTDEPIDFYVMSDNIEDNEITLIMSENLGENVAWITKEDYLAAGGTESDWNSECDDCGNNNKGPVTALKELKDRTAGWTNIPETTYNLTDSYNSPQQYNTIENITARARIITFSETCSLGCRGEGSDLGTCPTWLNGYYWTSSADYNFSNFAWVMDYDDAHDYNIFGAEYHDGVIVAIHYGIRPVITISKSVL